MRRIIKRTMFIFMAIGFILSIYGCAKSDKNNVSEATRTIIDMGGNEVVIPTEIKRVACGSNPGMDMMIAFGAGEELVAAHKTVFDNPWFEKFYPNAEQLMKIDSYEPEAESLLAMNVDIVFLPDPNICAGLREKGVCAVCLRVYNSEEVKGAAKLLGEVFGGEVAEKSKNWLTAFEESIADIATKVEDVPFEERPVVYEIIGAKYKGIYRTNYGDAQAWLEYGGGQIATLDLAGATWGNMPTEESIIATNPDVVLISGIFWEQLRSELYADEKWKTVPAIMNDEVYTIPMGCTDWNNYSTCYPLMNYYVFSVLYPDRVDFSLNSMAKDFYMDYYGVEFTDKEIEFMMKGLSPDGESTCTY